MPKRPAGKHLTEADRYVIEQLLREGHSIRYIAIQLGCSPSTVSREISVHAEKHIPKTCDCIYFRDCHAKNVCNSSGNCKKLCRTCSRAKKTCPDYSQECLNMSVSEAETLNLSHLRKIKTASKRSYKYLNGAVLTVFLKCCV